MYIISRDYDLLFSHCCTFSTTLFVRSSILIATPLHLLLIFLSTSMLWGMVLRKPNPDTTAKNKGVGFYLWIAAEVITFIFAAAVVQISLIKQ